MPFVTTKRVSLGKEYTEAEDVALYLKKFRELPPNYITKSGWQTAEAHGGVVAGKIIGGDTHWNDYESWELNVPKGATLKECDIATQGYSLSKRGTSRLVYTTNQNRVRVFYTEDHYNSFVEIGAFSVQIVRNVFIMIIPLYVILVGVFLFLMERERLRCFISQIRFF